MTFRSVPCQMGSHPDCDGKVHWVPVRRDGFWMGHIPEAERPKDLQPHSCPCRCHRRVLPQRASPAGPLHPGVSGEGDS